MDLNKNVSEYPTDLEIFIECYRRFGIECKVNEVDGFVGVDNNLPAVGEKIFTITLENSDRSDSLSPTSTYSEKIVGNAYTKLVFSKEGKFIEQGIWD